MSLFTEYRYSWLELLGYTIALVVLHSLHGTWQGWLAFVAIAGAATLVTEVSQ